MSTSTPPSSTSAADGRNTASERRERKLFGRAIRSARSSCGFTSVSYIVPKLHDGRWRWVHATEGLAPLSSCRAFLGQNPSAHERLEAETICADADDILHALLEPRLPAALAGKAAFSIHVSGGDRNRLAFIATATDDWMGTGWSSGGALDDAVRMRKRLFLG